MHTKVRHQDLITNLPDDVITHILSSLPTKDAVKTSVLSQQWKFKFTSIHSIDLKYNFPFWFEVDSGLSSLDSFMNKLFTQDDPRNRIINVRLRLYISKRKNHPDYPKKWILQILQRSIQNLEINVAGSSIQIPLKSCFPNLKNLYLNPCSLNELYIESEKEHLLLNFPTLEVLEMKRCLFYNAKLVEINVPKLNTLKYSWIPAGTHSFVLYAPELQCASFDQIAVSQCTMKEASAILKGAPRLKFLELSADDLTKALVEYWKGDRAVMPAFDQLKWLKTRCQPRVLVELLQRMPCLESLNLFIPCLQDKHKDPLPPCIVPCLKEVEFTCFNGKFAEIDLIKLFVENVRSLEKVAVCLSFLQPKQKDEIRPLLETLQPLNSSCVIVLK